MGRFGSAEGLPLTAAQSGMWFAQELDPDNTCFRAAEVVEIRGPVDVAALERALRRTVAETAAFRVRFVTDDEEDVRQVVEPQEDWPLPVLDLRGEPDPQAAAEAWMWADHARPVDLRRAPVFSFALLRTADACFQLYMSAHHIIIDGYGMALFFPRFAAIYTALEAGLPVPPSPLGPLEQALTDDADYHHSPRLERDRAYWAAELADWISPDHSAQQWLKPGRSFVRESGHLDAEATLGLRALARAARTSLPCAAMAALALYVHRFGDQEREDVALDVTVNGRSAASREVPCMLANVLPLRVTAASHGTVGALLRHTAERAKGLVRHQRYPFWRLARELRLGRRPAGPMDDWGINVMNHDPRITFGGHPAVLHNLSNGPVSGMSVNVYDRPSDGSLRIDFQADPAAYAPAEVTGHLRRFLTLLRTLAAEGPGLRLDDIDLLEPAERARVLDWGRGEEPPVPEVALHTAFEEQARRGPGETALVCARESLTRGELNARANQLAHLLRARGAGPGTTVAVSLPRTADYAVALLAVLKSGAACLPLDADHPAERTRMMLEDARPLCALATARTAELLPGGCVPVLVTDAARTATELAGLPTTNPAGAEVAAGDVAYLAFTSGTTGRPKGVVIEHRQLTHLFHDHERTLIAPAVRAAGHRLRAALTASFCFDTSWEGWLFLAAGQEVHLVEDAVRHDPAALTALVEEQRIDFLDLTPAVLRQLMSAGLFAGGGHHPGTLMVGGEALDTALWERLRRLPRTAVHNYYGPTECTVDAVWCRLDQQGELPVIGRPGQHVRAYVLDRCLRPLPPGVTGELYLGGEQVARGYLGRPELTARAFLPDPFGPPGARMYRTGDLVRWTAGGQLEYVGRGDGQIKLRGVRIEPREVETVLAEHPHIAQVAVTAQRVGPPRDFAASGGGGGTGAGRAARAGGGMDGSRGAGGFGGGTGYDGVGGSGGDCGDCGDSGVRQLAAHIVPAPRDGDDPLAEARRGAGTGGGTGGGSATGHGPGSGPGAGADSRGGSGAGAGSGPRTRARATLDPAELRSWAAARLPSAMVPSVFVAHESLPLTPQGKLDRAALPARFTPVRQRPARAPEGEHERTLCALFAEVLEVDEVGVDDDFFALGGHSLPATRLLARLRARTGAELALSALYQAPTVAGLARLLAEATPSAATGGEAGNAVGDGTPAGSESGAGTGGGGGSGSGSGIRPDDLSGTGSAGRGQHAGDGDAYGMLLPLRPAGGAPPLFCVHPGGGLGLCYAALPQHLPDDVPVYALQAQGLRPAERPATAFAELIGEYVARLRSVQAHGPYRLLGWSLGGALAHAIGARLQAEGEKVSLLALLDAAPIDPAERTAQLCDPATVRALVTEALGHRPLEEAHLAAVTSMLAHYSRLLPTFEESVFDGDLVFYRAAHNEASAKAPSPAAWRHRITGEVIVHDVPCTHGAMTEPAALAAMTRTLPLLS
ncbi:amino acid adenylation domain-containing protein [Streptomyces axinellae]|uniref:Carrier domain-containing protein n=1 Tax=Streptomyces axinellae TaxID=552788 RepID=A0ABP6D8V8_9ACTN